MQFPRTELLLGKEAMQLIARKKVLLLGVGGVGSWCAESLVRTGIHHLTIADMDCIAESNINRQLMATSLNIGQPKVEVLRERLLAINPEADIVAIRERFSEDTAAAFHLDEYDYIIDCIDSLKDKMLLIELSCKSTAVFFSSMGAALKTEPSRVRTGFFREVRGCPLARMLRKKLRQAGRFPERDFLCVYSDEVLENRGDESLVEGARTNGSLVHVTAVFGFTLASLVINDLLEIGV